MSMGETFWGKENFKPLQMISFSKKESRYYRMCKLKKTEGMISFALIWFEGHVVGDCL